MNLKKRYIITFAVVVVSLIFIISAFFKADKSPKYELSKVEKRTITEVVEASGTINPVNTVSIGTQVSGIIKEIYVDYNSKVKKGQILAQIDTSLFQAQVDQAQGQLNSAKANYEKARSMLVYDKANYLRYKNLYKKRYVSKDELDLAEANYKAEVANVNAMKASIAQYSATLRNNLTNLKYTRIISPVDGVVVSREVDVGQTVAASFQTPTLFLVAQDLTKMQIDVSVSEADIGKVKQGQSVEYTLDGYPNEIFNGKVSQVRLDSTTTSNVVTYTVVVTVNNDNGILKPGMSANVSIITSRKEDALCVDNAAMRFTPIEITGGKKFKEQGIWLLRDNKPVRVKIKTGITDSDYTEIITQEIQEGEDVIVGSIQNSSKKKSNSPKPPGML